MSEHDVFCERISHGCDCSAHGSDECFCGERRRADLHDALKAENERLRDALVWCSGSNDFAPGGKAREGWMRLCAPLLTPPTPKECPDCNQVLGLDPNDPRGGHRYGCGV